MLTDIAQNLTEAWGGQHRRPEIGFSTGDDGEPLLHIAWQHSTSGTVHYLKGTIGEPSIMVCQEAPEPHIISEPDGIRIYLTEGWQHARWTVWDLSGRLLADGVHNGSESIWVPGNNLPSHAIVSIQQPSGARWAQAVKR